jgi:hypothetical protein
MADPQHHTDVIEENIDSHPVKLALGVGIGAIALVVGIILLAQFAVGAYGTRSLKDDPAMSPEAVAKRLAPVAKIEIDPNARAPEAASAKRLRRPPSAAIAIPPPTAAVAPAAGGGKATYDATCSACHGAGVAEHQNSATRPPGPRA